MRKHYVIRLTSLIIMSNTHVCQYQSCVPGGGSINRFCRYVLHRFLKVRSTEQIFKLETRNKFLLKSSVFGAEFCN